MAMRSNFARASMREKVLRIRSFIPKFE